MIEPTPDSSSTLFVMWNTLEGKKDGIAEKGLFDEFLVLILIQFCGVCILIDLAHALSPTNHAKSRDVLQIIVFSYFSSLGI